MPDVTRFCDWNHSSTRDPRSRSCQGFGVHCGTAMTLARTLGNLKKQRQTAVHFIRFVKFAKADFPKGTNALHWRRPRVPFRSRLLSLPLQDRILWHS
jgi:hypothetical protein